MWVGEQREGDLVCQGERTGLVETSGCECDDFDPFASDLVVSLAQLREVPAAERSAEGAHEYEDHPLAVAVLAESDGAAAGAFEAEVGRLGTDGDASRFDGHQLCLTVCKLPQMARRGSPRNPPSREPLTDGEIEGGLRERARTSARDAEVLWRWLQTVRPAGATPGVDLGALSEAQLARL